MVDVGGLFFVDTLCDEEGLYCDGCVRTISKGESYIGGIGDSSQNICEDCIKSMCKMVEKEVEHMNVKY